MTKRRQISLLPQVHQTETLKRFFDSTVDQLFQDGKTVPVSGYIGRKPAHFDPTKDFYKPEPTVSRERYQLEPVMISENSAGEIQSQLFYEDLLANLAQEGAMIDDPNRLFGAGYYSWAPPIDIDRILNFQQYYWSGPGVTAMTLTVPGVEIGARYVGDGTKIEFALPPKLPGREDSEEDVRVVINGTPEEDFVIEGDLLTFDSAPISNANIVIFRYGNIVLVDGETSFAIPAHIPATIGLDSVYVFLNGVETDAFTSDETSITLSENPAVGSHVMVTRIKNLKEFMTGKEGFDLTGLNVYGKTDAISGHKIRIHDPVTIGAYDPVNYNVSEEQVHFIEGTSGNISISSVGNVLTGDQDDVSRGYIVIARSDLSRSHWSRRNRWVHRDALITTDDATIVNRAQRPIIEFLADVQQFNYGDHRIRACNGKISATPTYFNQPLDFTDINGLPIGQVKIDDDYIPQRGDVIFVNLSTPTSEHNTKLYYVDAIQVDAFEPLRADSTLIDADDDTITIDSDFIPTHFLYLLEPLETVTRGAVTSIGDDEYWFDGEFWHDAALPAETPIFDLFDSDGISIADPGVYPQSDFEGSRIFGFAEGSGSIDTELGLALRYDRYGQIVFENDLETRRYSYRDGDIIGYYYYDHGTRFENSWYLSSENLTQAIDENGISEIPSNLQANPDFETPTFLSRNDYYGHFSAIIGNQIGFQGQAFANNNWNDSQKDVTKGRVIIQHDAPLLKLMAVMENKEISLISALEFVAREYTRFKAKFLKNIIDLMNEFDVTTIQPDDLALMALRRINAGKTVDFAFHSSTVGGGNYFIPVTPSLLGIVPLVRPEIVQDDTFGPTVTFIRGHDGSFTSLFGDARDDALLALETRIYNNALPVTEHMVISDLLGGHYRSGIYTQSEFNTLMLPMFEKWARDNNAVFENVNFDDTDPFTWNYRSSTDRFGNSVAGHWRAIYRHFFDTDKPHLSPWEMLGFTQKPNWWESRYGPAPYTRSNTTLWADIEAGRIVEGSRAGIKTEYARPGLMQILPVDLNGKLLDPIAATIIPVAPPVQFAKESWQFGDGSNVETIWRHTSGYQFAVAKAKFLMRPAYFVERYWDCLNERLVHNTQHVHLPELRRLHHAELYVGGEILSDGTTKSSLGIQNWIVDHLLQNGKGAENLGEIIRGLKVQLGHKFAGFTTSDRMSVSAESFGLVPDEDITISLYRSPFMSDFFYSGMLIENTATGWRVVGYNPDYPFFDIIEPDLLSKTYRLTASGSARRGEIVINPWTPSVYYKLDMLVDYKDAVYRCINPHTSSSKFEETFWVADPQTARRHTDYVLKYERPSGVVSRVEYGTEFRTKQEIADLIFGYERWLKSLGFVFAEDDSAANSWTTAARNFLKWSSVEWADGAFVTLSPSARELKFVSETGVIVEIDNSILDRTGHVFKKENYSVDRIEDTTIITAHADDIYGAKLTKSEIEHSLIFSNKTIFEDALYDPLFNIRQYRLKMNARRAGEWAGRYNAPGFVLLGNDIVPNFVKLGEDIREMFDIELADNTILRDHARHLIGFETRPYLDQLLMNETQQFELYQGMIQQKGSFGALGTITRSNEIGQSRDLEFLEEWAFRLGTFGAYHPTYQMEFQINQADIRSDRQVVHFDANGRPEWLKLDSSRWVSAPMSFADIETNATTEALPDAGWVRESEVNYTVKDRDALGELIKSGAEISDGQRAWFTHADPWDVVRLSIPSIDHGEMEIIAIDNELTGAAVEVEDTRITFSKDHTLEVGDYFYLVGGLNESLRGEFEVLRKGDEWVEIVGIDSTYDPALNSGTELPIPFIAASMRVTDNVAKAEIPYGIGTIAYIEDGGSGKWSVQQKTGTNAWTEIRRQPKIIDNTKIASAVIYNPASNLSPRTLSVEPAKKEKLYVIDPMAGLIAGTADRELDYKIEYDPADYTAWGEKEVGLTWWDLSTARFVNPYTDAAEDFIHTDDRYLAELNYRAYHWGKLTSTSSVDIYEWTRALRLPDNTSTYVQKQEYDVGLNRTVTAYYFWAHNPETTPSNTGRKLSCRSVSEIIQNPAKVGIVWYAAIVDAGLVISGMEPILDDQGSILKIDYTMTDYEGDEHSEWVLMRPSDKTTNAPVVLWNKLIESLKGFDANNNAVPSITLHESATAGLATNQSMFGSVPVSKARESFVTMLNYILARTNFSKIGALEEKLTKADIPPEYCSWSAHTTDSLIMPPPTEYDTVVVAAEDVETALESHNRVLLDARTAKVPSLSIWINDGGVPALKRNYEHVVSSRETFLEELNGETIVSGTRVLIEADEKADGFWTVWEVNGSNNFEEMVIGGHTYGLVNAQKYRTRDFWYFADWYEDGISPTFPPTVVYSTIGDRQSSEGITPLNTFVKVLNDEGYWTWTKFVDGEWRTVARENATIQLYEDFFTSNTQYGVADIVISEIKGRDGTQELAPLVAAVRSSLMTVEQVNELWFSMIHFIHANIDKVDWAIKTSFLNVLGFNERLWPSPVAVTDNIPLLVDYLDEVKPYRVKVRDILRTAAPDIDNAYSVGTDFDKPVYHDPVTGQYRRLEVTDTDLLNSGTYKPFTDNVAQRRKTKVSLLFDRIWSAAGTGNGSADRIMAFYQPNNQMKAKSLPELLDLDFKGTIYDGSTLASLDADIQLKGSSATDSQIDVNVTNGFQLRDPYAAKNKPQELVASGAHDGVLLRAHDKWGDGVPQHTVRHYDISGLTTATVSLDVGMLADSIAVFRDGVRAKYSDYAWDALAHTVTVNAVIGSTRVKTVAIHAFGNAAIDRVKDQRYYKGGQSTYSLPDAHTGLVEARINGVIVDFADIVVSVDEVTLPATTSSDSVLLTLYSSHDPKPIRMAIEVLAYDSSQRWSLATKGITADTTLVRADNTTYTADNDSEDFRLPERRPFYDGCIVEVNGLRLTPPKAFYPGTATSVYVGTSDASQIRVFQGDRDLSKPVVNVTDITAQTFISETGLRQAVGTRHRYVLWGERLVFTDPSELDDNYVITVDDGTSDFTITASGDLVIHSTLSPSDYITVTRFLNDTKMDIRTHVISGSADGFYPLRTKRNGRSWLTLNGRRLVENVDYTIANRDTSLSLDAFEPYAYDTAQDIQIVLRSPPEDETSEIVITTFEGIENNPACTWQLTTKAPEEMRLLPVGAGETAMYIVRGGWEITKLDPIRRAGVLANNVTPATTQISLTLNPAGVPNVMIPSQPIPVPTEKVPGVIWIDGERIEYFVYAKNGNTVTLSELRRATRGSSMGQHSIGALVYSGEAELDRIPPASGSQIAIEDC